jgi:hypothetical protein
MKSAVIRFFTVMAVFHTALLACNVLNAQTVLNNDRLLIGTGSENSVNASGNLQQPFYYNSVYNLWRKLTFSNYPLDNAYAVDGDKTNEWNTNGTIVQNPVLTGQVVNTSGYVVLGPGRGYGTIISTGRFPSQVRQWVLKILIRLQLISPI